VFGALGRPWLKEAGERAQSVAAVVLVCDVVWATSTNSSTRVLVGEGNLGGKLYLYLKSLSMILK
jgi:hypothetical protein